jgi:transcriptional regulator with XRE-family HTH domain
MPSNNHTASLPTDFSEITDPIESRLAFCRALRDARKRRGLSLEDIAGVTKVCVSYFESLERGDLTYWPKAIFRRAFFRGYVEMIGMPVDEAMRTFSRLFPDGDVPPSEAAVTTSVQEPPRLELDASWHGARASIGTRVVAAMLDAAVVLAGSGLAWLIGLNLLVAAAVLTVGYFALARIVIDGSPAAMLLHRRRSSEPQQEQQQSSPAKTILARVRDLASGVGEEGVDQADSDTVFELPDRRAWTSDATRVRPRTAPPRIRVRFK